MKFEEIAMETDSNELSIKQILNTWKELKQDGYGIFEDFSL